MFSESKVESLLSNGANHSARTDIQGEAPLHLAARHGNVEGLRKILESGADANIRDIHGRTPLHLAVSADAIGTFKVIYRVMIKFSPCFAWVKVILT